ncbi:MAG: DUF4173 domain-containing protein [Clostridiales bacterium]|nr:DUF4173 domain-containing protein [Clostridiales bacterium]
MKQYTLLLMSIVSALLITTLLFGSGLGLMATLVTGTLLITFFISFKQAGKLALKKGFFLLIALICLSLSFLLRDQVMLHLLNLVVFFGLSIVYSVQMIEGQPLKINTHLITRSLEQLLYPIGEFSVPITLLFKNKKNKKLKDLDPKIKSVLIGIIIALPLLLIFTALLASADDVFSSMIAIDLSFLNDFLDGTTIPKIIVSLFSTFYIFSFFHYLLYKKKEEEIQAEPFVNDDVEATSDTSKDIIVTTVLVLMNLLFLVFTFIQFKYLFSKANIGFDGLTYSSYARKGFFELTIISMLIIGLILVFSRFTKNKANNLLMSLMVTTTLVIAYSAIFRMNLYIWAYGYTWLRIVSLCFIILQMLLLVITCIYLWYRGINIHVIIASLYLIAYLGLNFTNVDYFIVEGNITRYLEGKELDVYYFETLTYDATDSLIKYYIEFSDQESHQQAFQDIKSVLVQKEYDLKDDIKWYHYNYSKVHAKQLLN